MVVGCCLVVLVTVERNKLVWKVSTLLEPGRRVGVVCAWCRHLQARLASHAETLLPTLHILTACSPQTTALLTSTHRRGSISSYNSNAYSSKLTANTTARL